MVPLFLNFSALQMAISDQLHAPNSLSPSRTGYEDGVTQYRSTREDTERYFRSLRETNSDKFRVCKSVHLHTFK
jgi:hypothetical protein